jgi:HEAT repeat protein
MTKRLIIAFALAALVAPHVVLARPAESKRMERAKDLIADEQWVRAIDELKAAAADSKEPNRDEALFWLAHSENQARDYKTAIETISRLEREFPASRWVKPARSLRIEIAQRLQRSDVLWWYTTAPPTPPPAPPLHGTPPVPAFPPMAAPPARTPTPTPAAVPPAPAPPARPGMPQPAVATTPAPPRPPLPPPVWVPEGFLPDTDMRIQALSSLMQTDAQKVIPMLREIALDADDTGEARRALFVLAQSGRPDARSTVVEVAKTGPELVRLAAVRELGRIGGPTIANDLFEVYSSGNERVKYQVVTSLAWQDAAPALMRIARSEKDRRLRDIAIVTLGDAGGRAQLHTLYSTAPQDAKRAIVIGLFNAKAEDELIRIAEQERDAAIRGEVIARLRLLGTPKAKAYLERHR